MSQAQPGPKNGPRWLPGGKLPVVEGFIIAAVVGVLAVGFAYAGGWLDPGRLTPARIINSLEAHDGLHPSFRRAHAKGICATGYFEGNGQAVRLSKAPVFEKGQTPIIGRFSTGGGQPYAPDGRIVFHSMALQFKQRNGEEWRTAMDDTPIFPVATPSAFLDLQRDTAPDPTTGKPDPKRVAAYLAAHPETVAFMKYIQQAPLPSSFANGTYYSINAFRFTNAAGEMHFVRWWFEPETAFESLDKSKLASLGNNFLFDELATRLGQGPLRWHLILALAAPGDPVNDATKEWPADRERVDAGTLVLDHVSSEDDGPCNGVNFDPLILPVGIAASDDPLLPARSAAYSVSFTRRAGEAPQPSKIQVPAEGAAK